MDNSPKVILTFDLELFEPKEKTFQQALEIVLSLLQKHSARATFFVLSGEIAEKYPDLIKAIASQGHQIACHGWSHQPINQLGPELFRKEVSQAKTLLEQITNRPVLGFRAPYFSLNKKTFWALDILKELGFQYDSSLFPVRTPLYGVWRPKAIIEKAPIKEVPVSVFGGGIYFRVLPFWLFKWLVKRSSKKQIPVLFFHLQDFFASSRARADLKEPWLVRAFSRVGLKTSLKNFEKLLQLFQMTGV